MGARLGDRAAAREGSRHALIQSDAAVICCGEGYKAVMKLLLDKAVGVDSKESNGRTTLSYAAESDIR
jgi:hypothetical protein